MTDIAFLMAPQMLRMHRFTQIYTDKSKKSKKSVQICVNLCKSVLIIKKAIFIHYCLLLDFV